MEVFNRMKDWVHNKSQDFITKDPQSLIEILETYLFPIQSSITLVYILRETLN